MLEFSIKFAKEIDPTAVLALLLALTHAVVSLVRWWKNRVEVVLKTHPNMQLIGNGYNDDNTFITFRVTNRGFTPVVLHSITAKYWPSIWAKIFKKNPTCFYLRVADIGSSDENTPSNILAGLEWSGAIPQTDDFTDKMRGYLLIEANCSKYENPITYRLYQK